MLACLKHSLDPPAAVILDGLSAGRILTCLWSNQPPRPFRLRNQMRPSVSSLTHSTGLEL